MNQSVNNVTIERDQEFDINLSSVPASSNLSDFMIDVDGEWFEGVPVHADLFPLRCGDDIYNGHIRYTTDTIELHIIKNGDDQFSDHDGITRMRIDNLELPYSDMTVLYLVGRLRKI